MFSNEATKANQLTYLVYIYILYKAISSTTCK